MHSSRRPHDELSYDQSRGGYTGIRLQYAFRSTGPHTVKTRNFNIPRKRIELAGVMDREALAMRRTKQHIQYLLASEMHAARLNGIVARGSPLAGCPVFTTKAEKPFALAFGGLIMQSEKALARR